MFQKDNNGRSRNESRSGYGESRAGTSTNKNNNLNHRLADIDRPPIGVGYQRFDLGDHSSEYQDTTRQRRPNDSSFKRQQDGRVKRFLASTSSLSKMFVSETKTTSSDEARMFVKVSSKFRREDLDTKNFSQEIDDSQTVWSKNRLSSDSVSDYRERKELHDDKGSCDRCIERQKRILIIDNSLKYAYLAMSISKPILSHTISDILIRNKDHSCDSFVSSSHDHQHDAEKLIKNVRDIWKTKGYSCIITETHLRNQRPNYREYVSCGKHFQIHCLPMKDKNLEKARMYFKQALQSSEKEWSLNPKLIKTNGSRIQRCLPKGLSYFWVCFDNLDNGFGHIIEDERKFPKYFSLEILAGLLDKEFNAKGYTRSNQESYEELSERCRAFKSSYFNLQK